jgi:hypothetical protein
MPAIATSADGAYVFLALENSSSGFPVVVKAARTDLATWAAAYEPGAGTAANVAMVPSNPDLMLFYGNFGSGVQVVRHTISTGANENISPAGLTTKIINSLAVNPSDAEEMWATVDTDQDLIHTLDGGSNWETLDGSLGLNATALAVLWSGAYVLDRGFIAGDNGTDLDLLYTPNEGASKADQAGATLGAAAGICSLEVAEV